MYNQSIENSYLLLSGKATLDQLIVYITYMVVKDGEDFPMDMLPVFFIEPGEQPDIDQLYEMIDYFKKYEEYEKCQYLKSMIETLDDTY